MTVLYIEPNHIDKVWKDAKPILDEACERVACGYSAEHVRKEIEQGKRQLWVSARGKDFAVCVTHIADKPTHKTGVMAMGGGSKIEMTADFFPYLEDFFKQNGCSEIEMVGSPGWGRFMKRYGFKQKYIATARRL